MWDKKMAHAAGGSIFDMKNWASRLCYIGEGIVFTNCAERFWFGGKVDEIVFRIILLASPRQLDVLLRWLPASADARCSFVTSSDLRRYNPMAKDKGASTPEKLASLAKLRLLLGFSSRWGSGHSQRVF